MRTRECQEYLRALIEKQAESGQSGAAFCKEENINSQRFYFWRLRFHSDSPGPGFIRLVPTSKTPCSGIRINLDQGTSVELDKGEGPLRKLRIFIQQQDQSFQPTISFTFFKGRILTTLRAGLALNIVSSPVNGLIPFRALVAGLRFTSIFMSPGNTNWPTAPFLR
jgi:hypothetical protein